MDSPACQRQVASPLAQTVGVDSVVARGVDYTRPSIAGKDGAFAVAMLAELEPAIAQYGASFYRRLHWEAGAIGQVLYLEAEAAGVRATGIGCFFDDVLHELLGLDGRTLAMLYGFTVGGPLDDPRIRTAPPYAHLDRALSPRR